MRKIPILLLLFLLIGCAEMKAAADIVDIFVPDPEPCTEDIQTTVEKTVVDGVEVYRVSAPGIKPRYTFDEIDALSEAAVIRADNKFNCREEKRKTAREKREVAEKKIRTGDVMPQWEAVK